MKNKLSKVLVILLTICAFKTSHTLFMQFEIDLHKPAILGCEKSYETAVKDLTLLILNCYGGSNTCDEAKFLEDLKLYFDRVTKLEEAEGCNSPLKEKFITIKKDYVKFVADTKKAVREYKVNANYYFKQLLTEDLFTIRVPFKSVDFYLIDKKGVKTPANHMIKISNLTDAICELKYLSTSTNTNIYEGVLENTLSFKYDNKVINQGNAMKTSFNEEIVDTLTYERDDEFIAFVNSLYFDAQNASSGTNNPFLQPILRSTVVNDGNDFSELIKKAALQKTNVNPNDFKIKFTSVTIAMSKNGPGKIDLVAIKDGGRII